MGHCFPGSSLLSATQQAASRTHTPCVLVALQDNVPAFDSAAAIAIVESGLGAPIGQLFEEFDPVPIAAASLGQVHTAKVRLPAAGRKAGWGGGSGAGGLGQ